MLTRYDDIVRALHDPRLVSDRAGAIRDAIRDPEHRHLAAFIGDQMNFTDPPRHARLRGLVNKAFTPRAVDALAPRIEALVHTLLDKVEARGGMDVIADLAFPLPATVIAAMLGLPAEDLHQLRLWSDDFTAIFGSDPAAVAPEDYAKACRGGQEIVDYFRRLVDERRVAPRDDLLTALAQAEADGARLTEAELYANANVLLIAGHETTTHLIGNGLLALFRHPEQMARLRADPSLIPSAVEEFLRYDAPIQFMYRLAGEDVTIADKTIRKGQLEGPGQKLYVGETLNLRQRLKVQLGAKSFDFWGTGKEDVGVRFSSLPEINELKANQSRWITEWKPIGNYTGFAASL